MLIVRDAGDLPDLASGSVVTIGAYDGVHLGHRAVIGLVRDAAEAAGSTSVVVTFDRHPASVVRPESAPRLLCDLEQKLELLEATGVDVTLVLTFDTHRAAETADDFVREVLVERLRARRIIVGADFHFGKARGGNVALLESLGPDYGFDVVGVRLVDETGEPAGPDSRVSSTAIRAALDAGDVVDAAHMLGRSHEVRGTVVAGDRRGRDLGYPTANIAVPGHILLPADGIYAGRIHLEDGGVHPTAVSLGRRPTFHPDATDSLLEAHVLDFTGDLYGQRVGVEFVARLRGEERFDSVDALVAQIAQDCIDTRAALSGD